MSKSVEVEVPALKQLEIAFNRIKFDDGFNVREIYDGIDELAESIADVGLLTPLTVTPNGDDTFYLVSGHRRALAFKKLRWGAKLVPVTVRYYEKEDTSVALLDNLVENAAREDVHPADLARRLYELETGTYKPLFGEKPSDPRVTDQIDGDGEPVEILVHEKIDRQILCKKTGYSNSHVENLIRAHKNLVDEAKKAWKKYPVPLTMAFSWAKLKSDRDGEGTETAQDKQVAAVESWKARWNEEKAKLRTRAAKGKGKRSSKAEEENGWVSHAEVNAKLESLQEKAAEGVKGSEAHVMAGKIQALRWVSGALKRL